MVRFTGNVSSIPQQALTKPLGKPEKMGKDPVLSVPVITAVGGVHNGMLLTIKPILVHDFVGKSCGTPGFKNFVDVTDARHAFLDASGDGSARAVSK